MKTQHIAIFASGTGSNAENIIRSFQSESDLKVALVISNRSKAKVLEKAENLGVANAYLPKEDFEDEELLLGFLEAYNISWIVLAGFMIKIPEYLVKEFNGRIINIHPALLPKYGGKGMYGQHVHEAVKNAKESETGITIHLVNEEYDKGKILFQAKVVIMDSDTVEDIQLKVQQLEHRHYPEVIASHIRKNRS